jgi:hypothetical protein
MNENEVLDTLETYFSHHQPIGYHLNVLRTGVRRDGDWWYVAVQPDPPDVRARDYSLLMEQAEDDLEQQSNLKLLLLPVLPGD